MEKELTIQELLNIAKVADLKYISLTVKQVEQFLSLEARLSKLEKQVDQYKQERDSHQMGM